MSTLATPLSPNSELKVILVGDSSVGKTAIAHRCCDMDFTFDMVPTVGVAHLRKVAQIDGCAVELRFWDTAGSEDYEPLIPMYIRGAHIAIIAASVVDSHSMEHLPKWKQTVVEIEPDCVIVLALNKMDMADDPEIRTELTEQFQDLFPLIYFTSAKTGEEIPTLLDVAITHALKPRRLNQPPVGIEEYHNHHRRRCC
jgi:small GTP-binding protein